MEKRDFPKVPWITRDGTIDIARLPLEGNFVSALDSNRQKARESLSFLKIATQYGRVEASVFLMGLIVSLPCEDWEMRCATVEALRYTQTERCAALLFSEIRRVRSSNTTRGYISAILDVLGSFPAKLVRAEFTALADDTSFGWKIRQRFRELAEEEPGAYWY